jgi:hypothetical protein
MDRLFFLQPGLCHDFHGSPGGEGTPQVVVNLSFKKICPKMKLCFETARRKLFSS